MQSRKREKAMTSTQKLDVENAKSKSKNNPLFRVFAFATSHFSDFDFNISRFCPIEYKGQKAKTRNGLHWTPLLCEFCLDVFRSYVKRQVNTCC